MSSQLVAASFVLNRYVNDLNDIVKIRWLPVRQRLFPTFHLRRTRSTINVHSTKTFHNLPFLLLSLILNTANTVLRFQQQAIHMRNNDSVICLSYRLYNTTKHLSININHVMQSLISGLIHRVQTLAIITISCHFP